MHCRAGDLRHHGAHGAVAAALREPCAGIRPARLYEPERCAVAPLPRPSAPLGRDAAPRRGEPTGVLITADSGVGLRGAAVAVDFSSSGLRAGACASLCGGGRAAFSSAPPASMRRAARVLAGGCAGHPRADCAEYQRRRERRGRNWCRWPRAALGPRVRCGDLRGAPPHEARRAVGHRAGLGRGGRARRAAALVDVASAGPPAGSARRAGPGSIGFSSMRAGDIVGEHTVIFAARRRTRRNHAPRHRPHDVRARRLAGGGMADRPAARACTACEMFSDV